MPISITSDELVTLSRAAKLLPHINGKRPCTTTLWRWAVKGLRGVFLEHVKLGNRILTTPGAVDAFCRELAEADAGRFKRGGRPDRPNGAGFLRAQNELEKAGIL